MSLAFFLPLSFKRILYDHSHCQFLYCTAIAHFTCLALGDKDLRLRSSCLVLHSQVQCVPSAQSQLRLTDCITNLTILYHSSAQNATPLHLLHLKSLNAFSFFTEYRRSPTIEGSLDLTSSPDIS